MWDDGKGVGYWSLEMLYFVFRDFFKWKENEC